MKKFKSKNGFTLVECVVAMAVLAIMSLMLTMILNITVRTRNSNMAIEKDIDNQVENLMGNVVTTETRDDPIEFVQGAATIDSIPANGSDGIKANKIHGNGDAVEIDALDYNFDNYKKFEDIKKGSGGDDGGDDGSAADKVYGSAATSTVNIYEQSVTANGDGTKKIIVLKITFSASSISNEAAVKVSFPTSAEDVKVLSSSKASTLLIAGNVVRIEPTEATNIEAQVSFTLTNDEYNNSYKNVKNFYEGKGSGSPATLKKGTSGEFKP